MIYQYDDYRNFLSAVFVKRKQKNNSYSLGAYAISLQVPKSTLSLVLKKARHLPDADLPKVVSSLKLTRQETRYFSLLLEKERCKTKTRREEVKRELLALQAFFRRSKVVDEQNVLEKWYILALIELCNLSHFKLNELSGARSLGISQDEAANALRNLVEMGILSRNRVGNYKKITSGVFVGSEKVNFNLRNYHKEMLAMTSQALDTQAPKERFVGSETFAFNVEHLPQAVELIEECFAKIVAMAGHIESRDEVFHLGVQMIRLSKVGTEA